MKKTLFLLALALAGHLTAQAQRFTDQLDRGLVVVPTGASGNSTTNLVTWRRLAHEYYDVTYNLYKDGSQIATGLTTTTYDDNKSGTAASQYQVAAVVNGVEQQKSTAMKAWTQYVYKYTTRCPTGYLDIDLAPVYDRNGADVTENYSPNDAEMADLDGDGQLEIILKRLNTADASTGIDPNRIYSPQSTQFVVFDAYDIDWQTGAATLLWRIDCGPNMVSLNSTEVNLIAYDWDEDGRAEVVMRGADNMIVYGSDGKTALYTIGDMTANERTEFNTTSSQYAWTHTGAEYLLYINGQTGALYQQATYPLPRLESGETDLNKAWGDAYGHRSSKYFFGAPFLDGRKASLFLGRGIYTRHKFIAMDLDRNSHQWKERWRWNCTNSASPWYGNGYHNFIVADVDEDGRDEIVYGSMAIDDNGHGLSTTGYGHGDSQHVSDFDPYRPGLEFMGCLEEARGNYGFNYRNATTSQVYYKHDAAEDDGRCLMGNFSDEYPGSLGRSSSSGIISAVTDKLVDGLGGDSYIAWGDLNFRIYWDGDLRSEILNSPGTAKEAKIEKPGVGRLFTSSGCNMNNDSKNNACFVGDIIGDWREEIVVRRGQGLRVYTTGLGTSHTMPSLWFDHQYRQAMVWQMMAYNQTPHHSYFLGELENITVAPPPLTTRGRTEVASGGTIGTEHNGQHVLLCDAASVGIAEGGASPQVITVVVNSHVEGNDDNSNIKTSYPVTTQLGINSDKGDITGATRLVKQGDGELKLTNREFSYTGETNIWAGTLRFRGTLSGSPVWMNRHTSFFSGATLKKNLTMEYGATLYPSDDAGKATDVSFGTTKVEGTLELHEGARIVMQLDPVGAQYDRIEAGTLKVRTRSGEKWEQYGPKYLKPVIELQAISALRDGARYELGTIGQMAQGTTLSDIILEGGGSEARLTWEDGKLYVQMGSEKVSEPTVTGEGKIRYVTPGTSTLDNPVSIYYCTTQTDNPATDGTLLTEDYILMPNNTTYYVYCVASSGAKSQPVVVTFDGVLTETYDFVKISKEHQAPIYATLAATAIAQETAEGETTHNVYPATFGTYTLGNRFAISKEKTSGGVSQDWWIRYETSKSIYGLVSYTGKEPPTIYISLLNLRNGDKVKIDFAGTLTLTSSNVNGIERLANLTSGTEYTITTTDASTHLDISGIGPGPRINSVTILTSSESESVSAPTISIAAANGTTRTVSIEPGKGSQGTAATATYYTTDGSEPSSESTLYTGPFDISETTTVKAVSYLATTAGEVASQQVEAGTTLTLVAPTISTTGYDNEGNYTVRLTSNQTSLPALPQTLNYFYSIDGGETMRSGEGGYVTLIGGQQITAYVTAEGYTPSAETTLTTTMMPVLSEEWTIDFTQYADNSTSYSDSKLGDCFLLTDGTNVLNENFGVAGTEGTDSKNRFYVHKTNDGHGLYAFYGGTRTIAVNAKEGQYVRIDASIAPSAGSSIAKQEGLCYGDVYYLKMTATGIATINITRYTYIRSISVLNEVDHPTVAKTIASVGWGTYCSPYALDFTKPIDNLTAAYYVTGIKANGKSLVLKEITGIVPPRTGILLKGEGPCQIPYQTASTASTEGNLLVGVVASEVAEEKTAYVLVKEDDVLGFYLNNLPFTLSANSAYLPAYVVEGLRAVASNARGYVFQDDGGNDEPTAIQAPTLPLQAPGQIYSLSGQRVAKPLRKGLYIVNGKKVIFK